MAPGHDGALQSRGACRCRAGPKPPARGKERGARSPVGWVGNWAACVTARIESSAACGAASTRERGRHGTGLVRQRQPRPDDVAPHPTRAETAAFLAGARRHGRFHSATPVPVTRRVTPPRSPELVPSFVPCSFPGKLANSFMIVPSRTRQCQIATCIFFLSKWLK
ncbi:hypothetical protein ZWY2020_006633 [Hordeum vulgare]|nr:hypothetical protein ZWY2020_006633 [Hordeum vulgare]